MPEVGTLAPDFSLPADDGATVTLSALRGRPVVVYFYPRDDTPGCTTEACDFRDRQAQLAAAQSAVVLGISGDSLAAHQRFKKKYGLNFPLLSDADKSVMLAYGAYGKKIMYGKEVEGVIRSTFVIDRDGKVAAAWKKVSVKGHADAVLAALAALS
ncbi:MAG: thioredoxin-dependent thiol peroxidase [Deltaproteobacteria bacterium]|nr:thioredoxin-dependent thiol peroxidase [Deltaproteobacteria bacterium]